MRASHRTALPVRLAAARSVAILEFGLCGSSAAQGTGTKAASDLGLGLVLVQGQFLCAFWGIVDVVQ